MRILTRLPVFALMLVLLLWSAPGFAAPKVVVSVPPLHSLVSSVMQGAGEPVLLLDDSVSVDVQLSSERQQVLKDADLLVWVGSGLEENLGQAMKGGEDVLSNRVITLSKYLPLLPKTKESVFDDRQTYDLAFWTDPKLAIMAIRHITPQLVRLDPDHQELYLDNEIALIDELKAFHRSAMARAKPLQQADTLALSTGDSYFAHRFLNVPAHKLVEEVEGVRVASCSTEHFRKVSTGDVNTPEPEVEYSKVFGWDIEKGAAQYLTLMERNLTSLIQCAGGGQNT